MMQAVEAAASPSVQLWMNWMLIIFALSLIFVWKKVGARYALAAFVLGAISGVVIFNLTGDPWLLGISHILFWLPLLWILYRVDISKPGFNWKTPYGVWLALLIATIVISLVFDFRDVAMVLTGTR